MYQDKEHIFIKKVIKGYENTCNLAFPLWAKITENSITTLPPTCGPSSKPLLSLIDSYSLIPNMLQKDSLGSKLITLRHHFQYVLSLLLGYQL